MILRTATNDQKKEPNRKLDPGQRHAVSPPASLMALKSATRRVILRWLHDVGEARSPSEFAKSHDLTLSRCSYHFQVLNECGVIGLTDTRPARGALEHFYASTVDESALVLPYLAATAKEDETADLAGQHRG